MSKSTPKLIEIAADPTNHREICICGTRECAVLTMCFKSINDARGSTYVLPSLGGTRCADIKRYKLQRVCHHLGLGSDNCEKYATIDNRNRSLKSPEETNMAKATRSKKAPKRTRKSVAVHHFHPEVVQHCIVNGKVSFKDLLPESFVRENGLWENGYTNEDYYPEDYQPYKKKKRLNRNGVEERVFVPVPTYKDAEKDYQALALQSQLKGMVQECKEERKYAVLRPMFDETTKPVAKMQKLSVDKPEDLQRAVCALADENEHLLSEKAQLQSKMQEEMEDLNAEKELVEDLMQEEMDKLKVEKKEMEVALQAEMEKLRAEKQQLEEQLQAERSWNRNSQQYY